MRSISKFLAVSVVTSLLPISLALAKGKTPRLTVDQSYEDNYYKAEGDLIFKVKATAALADSKPKGFAAPTHASPKDAGSLVKNGYGLEGSTTIFFTSNIAAEVGVTGAVFYTSSDAIAAAKHNYQGTGGNFKRKQAFGVPVVGLLQYHMAPFGAIRPHVGVGYHGTYFFSQSNQYALKNTHGLAYGAGLEFVMRDDTMITLDIKRLHLQPKLTYKSKFLGRDVKGKIKIDPILISLGFGFKF